MRIYSAVVVHRNAEFERRLEGIETPGGVGLPRRERLATAEMAWRMSLDRAQRTDFLLVEMLGKVLYAAKVLGAERVIPEGPRDEGRVRFITSHHLPDFMAELIGRECPPRLLGRSPVRYGEIHVGEDGAVLRGRG